LRRSARSGRNCSLAGRVSFPAKAMPVQPFADRAAMHRHAVNRGHFPDDPVPCQVALGSQPRVQASGERGQLALRMVPLPFWQQATAFTLQDDHVIHKARRHPKVPGGLSVPAPLLDKGDDPAAKVHRMCLAQSCPPVSCTNSGSEIARLGTPEPDGTRHALKPMS
jgi:hypothetical protein